MATPTDPTVPLPTVADTDDDDDDDVTSIAPTPAPAPAPSASTTLSPSSQTSIPTPTSTDASVSSSPPPASENSGLGAGASAGIGVAVALAVIILLLGGWLFVRRRRSGLHRKRALSKGLAADDTAHDLETAAKGMGPEIREHRALGPVEMEAGNTSERRASELASPVIPVEAAAGDRNFAAELPGSGVPPKGVRKGSRERLFLDSPIDEEDGRFVIDSRPVDEKKPR